MGTTSFVADLNALALCGISATNVLDGGNGNDIITARLIAVIELGVTLGFDASNVLVGGNGHDRLEAYIEASGPFGDCRRSRTTWKVVTATMCCWQRLPQARSAQAFLMVGRATTN